jgi:hypothetical protein
MGVIQPAKRRVKPRGLFADKSVPGLRPEIQKYFKNMNYSLELWCADRELDPDVACVMLAKKMTEGDEESERVHRAAMRDFPITYRKVYNVEPEGVRLAGRQKPVNYSFALVWDEEKHHYVGNIKEFLDDPEPPVGYGSTLEQALESTKNELRKKLIILSIKKCINKDE